MTIGRAIIPSAHKGIFLTLFATIFITISGVGIVVPLLPVYAYDLGAAGIYVGMIFGSFSLSRTFLLPYFGRLSDQKGRKPFILGGLAGYALVSLGFILSTGVYSLIVIRFFQGAASAMIMPVVQAYVGEITPAGEEGYTMGLFNLSMFSSLSLGPLFGGVIKDLWSMNAAFACMGILSIAGFVLCLVYLPGLSEEKIHHKQRPPMPWMNLVREKGLFALFAFRLAYTACIGVIWCFLPLYADRRFSLSGTATGVLVMLAVLVSGVLHLPMGWVSDRFDKKMLVGAGGMICVIGMLVLTFSSTYQGLVTAVVVFGIGGGISMPSIMALAVIKGEKCQAMGSVMSVMTVAHSLGMLLGSMAAGLLMDIINLRFSFPFAMGIMVAGTLLFLLFTSRS